MNVQDTGNGSRDTADDHRHRSQLPPLASELFKQELYTRGYLKRPTSAFPQKSRLVFIFATRIAFPKVLGRQQCPKVAETECLRTDQADHPSKDATEDTTGLNASDEHSSPTVACPALRTPHADALDSPWVDTNTTAASDSFDLHEFSYLTAFTTPPSSPLPVLDDEILDKGAHLGGSTRAV